MKKTILFYVVLFAFILAFCVSAKAYDYDLWARLIVGKHFFETLTVMKHDIVSYIPTNVWYDHEWGSGVVFYAFLKFFSHYGLVILQSTVIFLIWFFISKCQKPPYNILFFICSVTAMIQVIEQPVRSQIFTFLFFTIFLYIFEKERKTKNENLLYVLPVLMIFWNNLHGGCVAGLGLFVLYIIGEFLNRNSVKKYFIPFLTCFVALIINPWGINYLEFLFKATTMQRPEILEWFNIFTPFFENNYLEFKTFAFVLLTSEMFYLVRFKPKFDFTKLVITLCTLCLAICHVKHIPLAVITLSIFFYEDFYTVFNFFTNNIFSKPVYAKIKDSLVYFLILLFIVLTPNLYGTKPFVEWTKYPIRIVEFIKINDIKGNILTNFAQGSFISYKLYPHNKIYMDGRYEELYPLDNFDDLQNFVNMRGNWQSIMKKNPPDIMILEKTLPVCVHLQKSPEWTILFDDNIFYLFVKTKDVKENYKNSPIDLEYYQKHIFDTDINFVVN